MAICQTIDGVPGYAATSIEVAQTVSAKSSRLIVRPVLAHMFCGGTDKLELQTNRSTVV